MSFSFNSLARLLACLFVWQLLPAQMTPNAPVKDFKVPRFADNGFTEWVLQGGKGIYDSEEQIRVEEMALRVYSGDERMALEMALDSPEATLRLQENRAFSDSSIVIEGANFKISGVGWTWEGDSKEIETRYDTVVEFTQAIADSFSAEVAASDELKRTEIYSEQLLLTTSLTEYRFEFNKSVHVISSDMDLKSEMMVALVDTPEGRQSVRPDLAPSNLESLRKITARDSVVIEQSDRIVRAGEAIFYPREKRVELSGFPQIEASGAYLSGSTISSQEGEIIIVGDPAEGRAQMILTDTGGLGLQGGVALSSQTIILADKITMREQETENQFYFVGSVSVLSGELELSSDSMTVLANKKSPEPATKGTATAKQSGDAAVQVGEVRSLLAEGSVRIKQSTQVVTCDKVTFYPNGQRAVLEGNAVVTNADAVVVGDRMELKPKSAYVTGEAGKPVQVTLPVLPDLGFGPDATPTTKPEDYVDGTNPETSRVADTESTLDSQASVEVPEADSFVSTAEASPTVIESQTLRMIEEPQQTLFRFTDEVHVIGTNLEARCKRMDVIAKPQSVESGVSTEEMGSKLTVERIEAFESVEIEQNERVATADKAFILPLEGKVILEGNSVVDDPRGRVTGYRMTLLQGERRAIVETGGQDRPRNKITLPPLKNGKF